MTTAELKKDFHNLIDKIDNEVLLSTFYDLIKKRISAREGQLWNNLTEEEQKELNLAFEESENPENLIQHDTIKKRDKGIYNH